MKEGLIARRYAQGLFLVVSENPDLKGTVEEELPKLHQEMVRVVEGLQTKGEGGEFRLLDLLLHPVITNEEKIGLVKRVFGGSLRPEILETLLLVLRKKRVELFPRVVEEFYLIVKRVCKIAEVTIRSAVPLNNSQREKLFAKVRSITGSQQILSSEEVDSTIWGGVQLLVEGKIIDGTLRSRLGSFRDYLLQHY